MKKLVKAKMAPTSTSARTMTRGSSGPRMSKALILPHAKHTVKPALRALQSTFSQRLGGAICSTKHVRVLGDKLLDRHLIGSQLHVKQMAPPQSVLHASVEVLYASQGKLATV